MKFSEKQKNWIEFINALSTVVVAVTGIVGAYFIYGQLKSMERQLEVMELDQRAWISASVNEVGDLAFNAADVTLKAAFKWKNIGKSPATDVWATYYLVPNFHDLRNKSMQIVNCENMRVEDREHGTISRTLFPNEEFLDQKTLVTALNVIQDKANTSDEPLDLYVIGCIQYKSGGRLHRTPYAYQLIRPTRLGKITKSEGKIPGSHLELDSRNVQNQLEPD